MDINKAIADALTSFPDLTPNGFGGRDFGDWQQDEVETAIAFLEMCGPSRHMTIGSYSLKHMAENWGGQNGRSPYVSNGALIAAAHALGFPIKRGRDSPNAAIGVGGRRRLRKILTPPGWVL